jgi:peptide/nickel transport system ATP-binding protein
MYVRCAHLNTSNKMLTGMCAASNMEDAKSLSKGPLLAVKHLTKTYSHTSWFSRKRAEVRVLQEVDFAVARGSTFALVGESGSGKSTLAKCLAAFERPDEGEIVFNAVNLLSLPATELRKIRPRIQLLFQDAATSLNPRFSLLEAVVEPLDIQNIGTKPERLERARQIVQQIGLSPDSGNRNVMEFSGGQRQRIAIARALTLQPEILILDEALSGLDLSMQGQILELLAALQSRYTLTYILISHDLALVGEIADQVAVLHAGRIIEQAAPHVLFAHPQHQQTQAMLRAMPVLETASAAGGS